MKICRWRERTKLTCSREKTNSASTSYACLPATGNNSQRQPCQMGSLGRVRLPPEMQWWVSQSQLLGKTVPLSLLHDLSLGPEVLTNFKLVSHGTPPIFIFEGFYCVKSHAPHNQSLMAFVQQDQLPLPTYPGGVSAWEGPSLFAHRC